MPNHVSTILVVKGSKKDVAAFLAAIKTGKKVKHDYLFDGEKDEYDFDLLLPVPEELVNTTSPTRIVSKQEYDKAVAERAALPPDSAELRFCSLPITQEMSDDYKERFGYDNWYDWRLNFYGTKWGMYDVQLSFEKAGEATFSYNTAWSPASDYFLTISEKFPKLSFYHEFADEGGGFVGYETIKNGEVVEVLDCAWESEKGIEIRQNVGYYYEEDEDDDDDPVGILESIGK